MSQLILRATKGSPLTHDELDHNFDYLSSSIADITGGPSGSADAFTGVETQGSTLVFTKKDGSTTTTTVVTGSKTYYSSSLTGTDLTLFQGDNTAHTIDLSNLPTSASATVATINPQLRYFIEDTAGTTGNAVQITSTGTVYNGLGWSREGVELTVSSSGAQVGVGDRVIVRGTNTTEIIGEITVVDGVAKTFTIPAANTALVTGTGASFAPLAKVNFTNDDDIQIIVPNSFGDLQINSLSIYYNNSETTSKSVTINKGAGVNTNIKNLNIPVISAWNLASNISAQIGGATVIVDTATNFSTYSLEGGLDTFGPVNVKLIF